MFFAGMLCAAQGAGGLSFETILGRPAPACRRRGCLESTAVVGWLLSLPSCCKQTAQVKPGTSLLLPTDGPHGCLAGCCCCCCFWCCCYLPFLVLSLLLLPAFDAAAFVCQEVTTLFPGAPAPCCHPASCQTGPHSRQLRSQAAASSSSCLS